MNYCFGYNICVTLRLVADAWSGLRLVLNTFYVPKHPSWFMQILRLD